MNFSKCQNTISLPFITNYTKQTIKGGLQTWDIKQDKNGVVFFANNEGLISFDGKFWQTLSLPNKTILRSIEISIDGKIYVGGQDEIGYFTPNKQGELIYYSLTHLLKQSEKKFGDVWDIVFCKNSIYFRTESKILCLNNNSFKVFPSVSKWLFLGVINNTLFAQDEGIGLLVLENNNWLNTNYVFKNISTITSLFSGENESIVLTTLKDGILVKKSNQNSFEKINPALWQSEQLYAAQKIDEKTFALSSTNTGLLIVDINGNILQKISRKEGLQNNNILSLLYDKYGNLWLGLNNGIDLVEYDNSIKKINPNFEDAAGYAMLIHKSNLYLGTANNLFKVNLPENQNISFSKSSFEPVKNAKGQCWGLSLINNKVLLGHHEGAFIVENDFANKISNNSGFWNFNATSSLFPTSHILAGHYNGLTIFEYINNSFELKLNIPSFNESSRFVAVDEKNNAWISHPYHGVFKINDYLNVSKQKIDNYDVNKGLPNNLENHVFKIKNEILVTNNKGIYLFNSTTNKFEPHLYYNKLLNNISIRYLKEDLEKNVWFVSDKKIGVIDYTNESDPVVFFITELQGKLLSGFENIYPINKNNIFISGENGFFLIDYEKYKKQLQKPSVFIRQVKLIAKSDSVLFGGFLNTNELTEKNKINHKFSSLHFKFSSTSSYNNSNLMYSYRLVGFEKNWSDWTSNTEKEYTNLNPGNYTFEVKVVNNLGIESSISKYSFTVLSPWYSTSTMKFIYFIVSILIILFIYKKQKSKFKNQQIKHQKEQEKLKYIHDLEISKTEAELMSLQNEKLAQEIEFKNSELALNAMHLVQKAEMLSTIKSSLMQIAKVYTNVQANAEIKKLLRNLGDDENLDREWNSFSKHFDSVHKDFLISLKEKHPDLTSSELKLSTYLHMNLSTKEIAQLLNISIRGVEISRYRLRKKLSLTKEVSLNDYMLSIKK